MDVADYQIEGRDGLVIDRKQNLDELCKNLFNKSDKSRFRKELRRAHEKKIKIIILCEHGGGVRKIEDVTAWKSAYNGVSGRDLAERIYRCGAAYGVQFVFCGKSETPQKILELLNYDISQ